MPPPPDKCPCGERRGSGVPPFSLRRPRRKGAASRRRAGKGGRKEPDARAPLERRAAWEQGQQEARRALGGTAAGRAHLPAPPPPPPPSSTAPRAPRGESSAFPPLPRTHGQSAAGGVDSDTAPCGLKKITNRG